VEDSSEGRQGINIEDAAIAIDIFRKALTFRPQIQQKGFGEGFVGMSLQQLIAEMLQPRVMVLHMGPSGKFPCLFFRFVGDESAVVEAVFYPYEAILSFLYQSRSYFQWLNLPDCSEDEKESLACGQAVEMTLIMIDSFHRRSELMMDSFVSEVIAQWRLNRTENFLHFQAERGEAIPRGKNPALSVAVQSYAREVTQFWKYQSRAYGGGQKVRFVEEYEDVYTHWKLLSKLLSEDGWREYAKAGKFQDTPDDLLKKLENTDRSDEGAVDVRISDLALEHAGRRARLVNKRGISKSIIRQRKAGIRVTGYTTAQLFNILREGRQIIERVKEIEAMRKSNEPLSNSGQEERPQPLEQIGDSALIDSEE
jgi:hypothetical protein